jgi:hypothetical protein
VTVNHRVPGSSPGRGAKQKSTMFYYIGNQCNLLEQVDTGLFLDKGWSQHNSAWYKGYSTECNLSENIDNILNGYKPKGIWCVISDNRVYQPNLCSFPDNGFTNLHEVARVGDFLELNNSINSMDIVVDNVTTMLVESCQGYARYNSDILNIWCTGGLDSVLLLAICEKANVPYNLYAHKSSFSSHVEYESNLTKHVKREFPNYSFLSLFVNKTVLATGYGGDNYFCRHPVQINMLANSLGSTALEIVKPYHYSYPYLHKHKFQDIVNPYTTEEELKKKLLHQIQIWHSVWHIDNTITFTPYHDVDLFKMVLTLPLHELIDASLDGTIQKKAIEKCNPELLSLVDEQKNTALGGKNLFNNLERVKLSCCKKIFIV